MPKNTTRHETQHATWRKKIKKVNVLALLADEVLWQPQYGRQFMLSRAYIKVRNHTGTNTDLPAISLDNGTDGQDVVAAVDIASTVVGAVQRLTVIGNLLFDHDKPLRLQISDAPAGSTVYDVDIILFADEISEIQS